LFIEINNKKLIETMTSLMSTFLGIQSQFKVFHWQTQSYSKHQAYGGIYDTLSDLSDEFMETYMGKYGRVEFNGGEGSITLKNTDTLELNNFLNSNIDWLKSLNEKLKSDKDSDLLNLRDEMMGEINKLKYLLTLK
jgi:DNA-binding ferritin-like protein